MHGARIVSLVIDSRERLCLAQISNSLLKVKKKQSIPKESLLSNIFFEILFILLLQLKSFSFQEFSYNEIHNRRVALGITCVQCTPVQLEILRRAGAMPISSRSTILFFCSQPKIPISSKSTIPFLLESTKPYFFYWSQPN